MALAIAMFLFVFILAIVIHLNDNKPRKVIEPTVPPPRQFNREQEFLARIKHIKTLADKGKHDRAIALLRKLEMIDITNTPPTNLGELKE